jgi:hypothetical protein
MKRLVLLAAVVAVLDLACLSLGWWWAIAVVGLAVAAVAAGRRPLSALVLGTLAAAAVSLVWQGGARTLDVADLTGAMALNTRGLGWAVIAATLAYTLLLVLTGAWLGAATRRVRADIRSGQPARPEPGAGSLDTKEDEHV